MNSPIIRLHQNERRSRVVIYNGVVSLAGQVADDLSQDITGQTKQAFAKIDDMLSQAGTDKSRLLTAQIWLADAADYDAMNAVWDAWVTPGERPTRCCAVLQLPNPEVKLEIVVTAAISSA